MPDEQYFSGEISDTFAYELLKALDQKIISTELVEKYRVSDDL